MELAEDEEYLLSDEDDHYETDDDADFKQLMDSASVSHHVSVPSSQVITRDCLLAAQRDILQRVMDLLMVEERHARTLLIHYHWDLDKLVTIFAEKGQEQLFAEAGVKLIESDHESGYRSPSSTVFCSVCLEDVLCCESTRMDCQHSFCNHCWIEHFIVKISEGNSRRIRCMADKCNTVCDESVIRDLVSKRKPDLAKKFDRFLLESYIEENKLVKWCPSVPHCGNAIRVESDVLTEVGCTCGLQFCFNCLSEAHSPCSCLMWELWSKKWKQESSTMNWIKDNTKNCPSCHKIVEKNGGCNIVLCVCGKRFCWMCSLAKGYGHNCGRYTKPGVEVESVKASLYRYMHYYDRFKAHRESLILETKLQQSLKDKISLFEMELELRELRDFSWLGKGMSLLFQSRRVLSHSYAFAFYMFGDELFKNEFSQAEKEIKKNLFEDQQQQYEANVEKLSRFIEEVGGCKNRDDVIDIRSKVIVLSKVVDKLCRSMYECIEVDLLGSLRFQNHSIALYRSEGVDMASQTLSIKRGNEGLPSEDEINGWMRQIDESSSSNRSTKRRKAGN